MIKYNRNDNGDVTRPKDETETNTKLKVVRDPFEYDCVWLIMRSYPIFRLNLKSEFSKAQLKQIFVLVCKDINYNREMGFNTCNPARRALNRERKMARSGPMEATSSKRRKVVIDERVQTNDQWNRCIIETKNTPGVDYKHEQGTN